MFPEGQQGEHKSKNLGASRFVSYFTMFLKVGHLLLLVCWYAFGFRFFGREGPFFRDVPNGLLIFDCARRGGQRCRLAAVSSLASKMAPRCPQVSNLQCVFACGCRFISYFTMFSVPPAHILGPSWVHLGASWGHLVAISGRSRMLGPFENVVFP